MRTRLFTHCSIFDPYEPCISILQFDHAIDEANVAELIQHDVNVLRLEIAIAINNRIRVQTLERTHNFSCGRTELSAREFQKFRLYGLILQRLHACNVRE